MKGNDELNLTACLLALLRYVGTVPSDLHTQIQQAQAQLPQDQHQAIQALKTAIQQHEPLARLYTASRSQLFNQYSSQERAKSAATVTAAISSRVASEAPEHYVTEQDRIDIVQLATAILNSPDANYRKQAQKAFNQPTLQKQIERASGDLKVSAQTLEQAAWELHPTKVALMKKLDKRILALSDIAYILDISIESARQYVKALWNEGYIRPISSSFWQQIWLSLKGAPPIETPPDDETYLKLTAKGYFYLHPGSLSKRKAA